MKKPTDKSFLYRLDLASNLLPEDFDTYDEADLPNAAKKRVQLELYKQKLYPYKCIGVVLGQT